MKYTQDWTTSAVTQIKSAPCLPGSGKGHFPAGTAAIADTAPEVCNLNMKIKNIPNAVSYAADLPIWTLCKMTSIR